MRRLNDKHEGIAIYGETFDGIEKWVCYGRSAGCPAVIAVPTDKKPDSSVLGTDSYATDGEAKYLIGPKGHRRLANGTFDRQLRPHFRSPEIRDEKRYAHLLKSELDGAGEEMNEIYGADQASSEAKISVSLQNPPSGDEECWISMADLPTRVKCKCGRINVVPSYRAALDFKKNS